MTLFLKFYYYRLNATRARLIADKYNLIMKNIQPEEVPLFEIKLNRIDSVSILDSAF
jgi:hypothetical protein